MHAVSAVAPGNATPGFEAVTTRRRPRREPVAPAAARAKLKAALTASTLASFRRVDELHARRLDATLDSDLPAEWAYDTALADLSFSLPNSQLTEALGDYLRARLREELPLLRQAGELDAEQSAELENVSRSDHALGWAAVRAGTLLRERARLADLLERNDNPELRRAVEHLDHLAQQGMRNELADPPRTACAESTAALSLMYSFSRDERLHEFYAEGTVERHRELLAKAGHGSDAPVVAADYRHIGAMCGRPGYAKHTYGNGRGGEHPHVLLNARHVTDSELADSPYSVTITHELIHTLQGEHIAPKPETTMAELSLHGLLLEGSTEGLARILLAEHVSEFDERVCENEMAFVFALCRTAAGADGAHAHKLLGELAHGDKATLSQRATRMLCAEATPERCQALANAAVLYESFVCKQGARPTPQQRMDYASELLAKVKDGVPLRAEQAA